jgi:hypothetical protein
MRASRVGVCVLSALLGCACSSERPPSLAVEVRTSANEPVEAFQATLAFADGSVKTLACPDGSTEDAALLRCNERGFEVLGRARPDEVTLRSRGNGFTTKRLAGDQDTVTWVVSPLAPAENGPDYATRLDGPECLQQLDDLALPLRSELGDSHSVKFYIRNLQTDPQVYFQNTKKHPLHFDFARNVLGVTGTADVPRPRSSGHGRHLDLLPGG